MGPFKNRGIEDAFGELNEVRSKSSQCFVIAGLITNAHDLTQEQLNYLACLLCQPWKSKRGAPKLEARNWKLKRLLRKKYAESGVIPSQREIIDTILIHENHINGDHSARAIFQQIKDYIEYVPATKGRPKKVKKSADN